MTSCPECGVPGGWHDQGCRTGLGRLKIRLEEARKEDIVDPYHYARDHDAGPGAWCVYGPDGFKMATPNLQKSQAYMIGKILSGDYKSVKEMLREYVWI